MMLTSCSRDKYSKELLVSNLYSTYTASADFIFSDGTNNTEGKASVTKSDVTCVVFSSPVHLQGVSVKGDNAGNADILSFEFSGIPASVPKSITSDLSLMFSLFSDTIPSRIDSLEKDAFRLSENTSDDGNTLCEVFFLENGVSYVITYDVHSGIPHSIDAGNDKVSVSIELSDFNTTKE